MGSALVVMRAMATLFSRAEVEVMQAVRPEGDPVIFGENVRRSMYEGDLTVVELS